MQSKLGGMDALGGATQYCYSQIVVVLGST